MNPDRFEATFRVRLDRASVWQRLTNHPDKTEHDEHLWLPGFDAQVTLAEIEPPHRLRGTKDDEPCAGTDIAITLEDDDTGTRIHVVQSRFGDWLPKRYGMMTVGWRYIVADLHTYLATGAHPRRHHRPWGDLGADATAADGGLHIHHVRDGGLAERLGMADGDLLVVLNGAPVASLDDLSTILRVLTVNPQPSDAQWIRSGALMTTPPPDDLKPRQPKTIPPPQRSTQRSPAEGTRD